MPTKVADRFQFTVFSLSDFTDRSLVDKAFDLFDALPHDLRPERYGPYEPVDHAYDVHKRPELVSAWLNEESARAGQRVRSGSLCLESGPPARAAYLVDWDKDVAPRFNMVSGQASVSGDAFTGGLRDFIDMTQNFVAVTDAVFAVIDREFPQTSNLLTRINLQVRLPNPYWMMFFGAPYVELFGRDRFRTAPCHEVAELPSGHFRLMVTPSPHEPVPEEAKKRIREHFGSTAFIEPGKSIRSQKVGLVPSFDFSRVYTPED